MKITNSKNLFKDFSAIFHLTNNNISLIRCNPHKDKLIFQICVPTKHLSTFTYQNLVLTARFSNIFRTNILLAEIWLKGALSDLRQILTTESPLKMMKNAFYFTSKAFFVLKIFKFLSWLFGHVSKRLDKKDKVNFKFYNVTTWLANNCNTQIAKYFEK